MALAGMAPFLSAVGPASAAMKLLGAGAQGTSPSPFGGAQPSPFDGAFNPDMAQFAPEPQPRGQQPAQLQSVFDETPGLMASALLGGDTEGALLEDEPPPPVRIDLAEVARNQNKPSAWSMDDGVIRYGGKSFADYMRGASGEQPSAGGDGVKYSSAPQRIDLSSMPRPKSNEELLAEQGYSPTSVQANVFDPSAPQGGVTDIPRAAPGGGVTDIPRSAFDEPAYDDEVPAPVRAPAAPSAFEPTFDTSGAEEEAGPFDSFGGGLDYVQDWLGESNTNPLFQTGMALLASGYDGSNPFTNMQAGLGGVQKGQMDQAKSDLDLRVGEAGIADAGQQKQLQEALAMIAAMYGDDPSSYSSKGQASLIR